MIELYENNTYEIDIPNRIRELDDEVVEWPKCYDDTFRYPRATDNGFHLSKVRTYRLK